MSNTKPYVLSIAGFDPSAGAGILSDIKTFEQNNVYGLGVISANTIQNDSEYLSTHWIDLETILEQLEVLFKKYSIDYVKIGLIENLKSLNDIIELLKTNNPEIKIIWDPILKATAGKVFHSSINDSLLSEILSKVYLVTPNLEEIKKLFQNELIKDLQLKEIVEKYQFNLLLKGGHSGEKIITDKLFTKNDITEFFGEKFSGYSKHGTGCVLSSAITASLASGNSLADSCKAAKQYVEKFIISNETNLGYHN